jgi:hypothetical protein
MGAIEASHSMPARLAGPSRWLWRALLVLLLLGGDRGGQAQVSREYQLKAVFLFRLTQFAEWPAEKFESAESPMIIGVAGRNPFGDALHVAVKGETAQSRRIVVRAVESPAQARGVHVLFLAESEAGRAREYTRALSEAGVLTVSDMEEFVPERGGMVQFTNDGNKVNLRIDPERAKRAGLTINSRLLRMAEVVQRRE